MNRQQIPVLRIAVVIFFALLTLPATGTPAAPGSENSVKQPLTIVYGADEDFAPYEWVSDDGTLQGFNIDLMREIGAVTGANIKFVHGPWPQIKKGQREGWIDITAMFKSAARAEHLAFSNPMSVDYDTIWIRKGDKEIQSLDDLADRTVIVQATGFTAEYLTENVPSAKLILVNSEPQTLKALASGRGDCAMLLELAARTSIKKLGLKNIRKTGTSVLPRPYSLTATKDKANLLPAINEALAKLRADGRYGKLESKWLELQPTFTPAEQFFRHYGWYVLAMVIFTVIWLATWTFVLKRRVSARNRQLEAELLERTRTEEELRKSEELFYQFFSSNPLQMGISTLPDERYKEVNPVFTKATGYSREEAIGKTSVELGLWDNDNDRLKVHSEVRANGFCRNREIVFRSRTGKRMECIINVEMVVISGERLIMTIINDITELRETEREKALLENQLRQVQKIEMAGRLAGGVAHDFNNQLTIIRGYSDILGKRITAVDDLRIIEEIRKAVDHSSSLTSSLLAFSRKQVRRLEILNPASVIKDMQKTIAVMLGENIDLRIVMEEPIGTIEMDRTQLEQVIINIVANARDAMGSKGSMDIHVENVTIKCGESISNIEAIPGDYVVLSMTDDGIGINEETQKLVFEPFFTTKEIGKGTGLGLSIVYGIVKQNGGHIELTSAPGKGSTFKLFIPRVNNEPVVSGDFIQISECSTGTETVLLVEDEEGLFQLLSVVLSNAGYNVLAADRPGLAVRMAAQEKPDILVTDVVMPEMSGKDLAEQVSALHPDIKILYMSGYPRDTITAHGILSANVDLLSKPFSLDEFLRVVRQVLDA
jgi:two-component system sensor histidine kinase EvgS